MVAAGDSVAAVAVAPVESAIAGKRFTPIEQAKGCHESMAPFFFGCAGSDPRCVMQWAVFYAVSAVTTGDGAGRRGMTLNASRQ